MHSRNNSNTTSRRRNGLERPWHGLQVATWILYPVVLLHYFAFLMQLLWENIAVNIIITAVFCFSAIVAAVAAYQTCAIDPIDNQTYLTEPSKRASGSVYCYLCEAHVHSSSKHCKFCDKCIEDFDHHCKWLNTCVGKKNYRHFLTLVGSITLLMTISLTLSAAYIIEFFSFKESFRSRIHDAQVYLDSTLVLVILCVSLAILVPLVILVYQLAGFHAMLRFKGLTTYDFIVLEQKRQRDASVERARAKRERIEDHDKTRKNLNPSPPPSSPGSPAAAEVGIRAILEENKVNGRGVGSVDNGIENGGLVVSTDESYGYDTSATQQHRRSRSPSRRIDDRLEVDMDVETGEELLSG